MSSLIDVFIRIVECEQDSRGQSRCWRHPGGSVCNSLNMKTLLLLELIMALVRVDSDLSPEGEQPVEGGTSKPSFHSHCIWPSLSGRKRGCLVGRGRNRGKSQHFRPHHQAVPFQPCCRSVDIWQIFRKRSST